MGICTNCGNQIFDESAMACPVCGIAIPGKEQAMDPYATIPGEAPAQSYSYQSQHGFQGTNAAEYKKAAAFTLIGMILLILTLALPWYTWNYELENTDDDASMEFVFDEGLFGGKMKITQDFDGDKETQTEKGDWSDDDDEVSTLYTNLSYIMIIAVILGILGFVMVVGSGANSQFKISYNQAGCYLSIFAAFLSILSVIILMLALPLAHDATLGEEMQEDGGEDIFANGPWDSFWGSSSGNVQDDDDLPYSSNWHPTFGWFIAIAAGVLNMIGGAIIYKAGKSDLITAHNHGGPQPVQSEQMAMTGTPSYDSPSQGGNTDQSQYAPAGDFSPQPKTLTQPDTPPFKAVPPPLPVSESIDEASQCKICGAAMSNDQGSCPSCGAQQG